MFTRRLRRDSPTCRRVEAFDAASRSVGKLVKGADRLVGGHRPVIRGAAGGHLLHVGAALLGKRQPAKIRSRPSCAAVSASFSSLNETTTSNPFIHVDSACRAADVLRLLYLVLTSSRSAGLSGQPGLTEIVGCHRWKAIDATSAKAKRHRPSGTGPSPRRTPDAALKAMPVTCMLPRHDSNTRRHHLTPADTTLCPPSTARESDSLADRLPGDEPPRRESPASTNRARSVNVRTWGPSPTPSTIFAFSICAWKEASFKRPLYSTVPQSHRGVSVVTRARQNSPDGKVSPGDSSHRMSRAPGGHRGHVLLRHGELDPQRSTRITSDLVHG